MAQAANLTTSCTFCTDPDDGNMVTCSKCLNSYHSNCCNVEADVDIFMWTCQKCKQNATHNLNFQLPTIDLCVEEDPTPQQQPSSTLASLSTSLPSNGRMDINARKKLQLQQLEEEMKLKEEFLRRKYELLAAELPEVVDNVRPVNISNEFSTINIPQCVQNCQQNKHISRQVIGNTAHCSCEFLAQTQTLHSFSPPHISTINHNRNDQTVNIPNINNQNKKMTGCQQAFCLENTNNTSNTNYNNNCESHYKDVTTTQLIARQCISRDLPSFNGDPREWPIFISAFEQSTHVAGYTNEENLVRLQKCLHGKARDAVRNCLMLPDMVPDIIRTLKMYFGRPQCVIKSLIDDVRKITIKCGKLETLIEFAFAVKNVYATIRASRLDEYLINPTLLQELVEKLPPDTVLQWAMYSKDILRPNLKDFSDWLYTLAEATCRVTVPVFDSIYEKKPGNKEGRLNTHTASAETEKPQQQCAVCNEQHKLTNCLKFKDMPTADKWGIVKANSLCRICLGKHKRRCWFTKQCGVNGCTVQHNSLLHNEEQPCGTLNSHKGEDESYFRIVPVTLYSDTKSVTIYALMDDGSSLTLLDQKIADLLSVKGINDPLCIRWTGDVSRYEDNSIRVNLKISSTKPNSQIFPVNAVCTVKNLDLSSETMVVESIKQKFPYLVGIPLEGYENVIPSMIIGTNNPNLISSLKTVEGDWQQPVASKTRLGWTLFGGGSQVRGKLNFHRCGCDQLNGLVKQYFADENVGIEPPAIAPMSKDDQKAMDILEKTCKFIDGQYEVGLLWKCDPPELPYSLATALKRLHCIQQKANHDPKLAEVLQQQIMNLENKGYAQRLPNSVLEEKGDKIWYLPTFIVKNPNKPNKIRLVWDAAAKSGSFALNDFLLKGPDLLMPLMNILFKFRMGAFAVCGDIAEMFHRIKVRKEDAGAQRFLWWDSNNSMVVYQLNVLTFGASCSPCISHFVRDRNAENFGRDPRVIEAITKQHYVDDFIDSTSTVEEAIDLALNVREVHANGGFYMRNWSSNSLEVLSALGENTSSESKSFENNEDSAQFEKILGLYWNPKNDVFKMNLKFVRLRRPILSEDIVPTKREVLQVLMSVFDPLGFVVCFMSYLKSILQEIWRCGIDWDQPLNDDLFCKWKNWLKFLPIITAVSIPRCYSMAIQKENYVAELHTFVDASEDAYAAVSYFRIEYNGNVETRLVAAKAKVAPLRPLSVPRLELQAAAIGARLTKTVSCHNIKFQRRVMWTDSKTVLNWLTGDPRKYRQFVMFRVAEILKFTTAADWRWVPSAMNVADFATKYRPPSDCYKDWFDGPSWLRHPENEWPMTQNLNDANNSDMDVSELRPSFLNIHTRWPIMNTINFEYFSSWFQLYRGVGIWLVYIERLNQKLKQQKPLSTLNASHLIRAKTIIYKNIQMSCFADEYYCIRNGKPVPKGSSFDKLNLYIDDDGVVRVRNRAIYAPPACGSQRDLIVLPSNHRATALIVNSYHCAYHHMNHETVLNEIRQTYFIFKLRVIYKIARRNCQKCKNEAAKPMSPQMSPLPPARLGAFQRPFTFVGVDYFGPIAVTFGRKSLKRWGVLFTCLTIRAVHIEIAHTLSTDSFLMTLRNFIARRGAPAEIYSDNGTNFRGADRFLREELKNIKFDDINTELAYKGISWKFNPPAAPHMGGAWERLVRSIKVILYKISPSQKFTDESLRSALMEVEMIINSRPLTYVSLETEDQEAITPNHFILGSSNGAKPFCKPESIDHKMCLRQSEVFANMFWRRFVKEMLPTLTRRGKWSQRIKPIEVGDIVLVVDENAERNSWLKGRVVEVTIAKDGQVRRAKIKTKNGIMERPAVKLAILDVGNGVESDPK